MSLFESDPKTKLVVHYVISHTQPDQLGATKLNKVLWHADVMQYRRYGKTVTGQASYRRMPQGPVPNHINDCIRELKSEGKIIERPVETYAGTRREFVAISRASVSPLSNTEVEALHESISYICRMTAGEASENTHDALWKEIEDGAQIPVKAAAAIVTEIEPEDIDWAIEALKHAAE